MKTKEDTGLKVFCFLIYAVICIPSYWWSGFVAVKLWTWFAVSPFGLPSIGIAHFCGIRLLVSYLTPWRIDWESGERSSTENLARTITMSAHDPGPSPDRRMGNHQVHVTTHQQRR